MLNQTIQVEARAPIPRLLAEAQADFLASQEIKRSQEARGYVWNDPEYTLADRELGCIVDAVDEARDLLRAVFGLALSAAPRDGGLSVVIAVAQERLRDIRDALDTHHIREHSLPSLAAAVVKSPLLAA